MGSPTVPSPKLARQAGNPFGARAPLAQLAGRLTAGIALPGPPAARAGNAGLFQDPRVWSAKGGSGQRPLDNVLEVFPVLGSGSV